MSFRVISKPSQNPAAWPSSVSAAWVLWAMPIVGGSRRCRSDLEQDETSSHRRAPGQLVAAGGVLLLQGDQQHADGALVAEVLAGCAAAFAVVNTAYTSTLNHVNILGFVDVHTCLIP